MSSAALAGQPPSGSRQVELSIQGMTCAACAVRVEKRLSAIDGVVAAVNFATEKATVRASASASASVSVERLIEAVEQAGYGVEGTGPASGATGVMAVTGVEPAAGTGRAALLRRVGAVEDASGHPVAAAISAAARAELGTLPQAAGFEALPGLGARGVVDGHEVIAGRERLFRDRGITVPESVTAQCAQWEQAGRTVVLAGWDGQVVGAVAVADTVKPSAAAAVAGLRRLGLRTVLLTGDSEATAMTVAAQTGVDEVIAGALPGGKVAVIRQLQAQGRRVAMAGDGVNDGPALAAADLGLALGSGADVAISAADLILLRDDLGVVPDAIRLARATLATIRRNLTWAFGYNIAAIPLAAAGFLNPLIAGAAMALSSAFVVASSVRLRRFGAPAARADRRLPPSAARMQAGAESGEQVTSCPG